MKQIYIAGNWKSNKTIVDALSWINNFSVPSALPNITIQLFVPFGNLYSLQTRILEKGLPVALGAQNVSAYSEGPYTGEISARMVKEVASWVMIGHSERRTYFHEDDEVLRQKVLRAKEAGLRVLFCVSDEKNNIPDGVDMLAYEPLASIGSGNAETPEIADDRIALLKSRMPGPIVYGGSVTLDNIESYITMNNIDGILAGGFSLDPDKFASLVRSAQNVSKPE